MAKEKLLYHSLLPPYASSNNCPNTLMLRSGQELSGYKTRFFKVTANILVRHFVEKRGKSCGMMEM